MKKTKKALLSSMVALFMSITMLIGSTFAWFTDHATSSGNIIKAGNLDLKMYWTDDLSKDIWYDVEDPEHNVIFNYDNWEPGYTEVRYIKIENAGKLAFNYNLAITPVGEVGKLAEVINVFCGSAKEGIKVGSMEDLSKLSAIGLLNNVMDGKRTANGTLLAQGQSSPLHNSGEEIITIAMNMITTAGNEYQGKSIGDGFKITGLATQCAYEEDGFGSSYDNAAEYPVLSGNNQTTTVINPEGGKVPAGGVVLTGEGVSAEVPAGVELEEGVDKLTFSVTPLGESATNITTVNQEILIPVDVHISGVSKNNTTPIIVNLGAVMPKYLNMGNYTLFHVEDGENVTMTYIGLDDEFTAHNQFKYNPVTGELTLAMATFSEVAVVADTSGAWKGEFDYSWYDSENNKRTISNEYTIANADQLAAFGAIVGGMDGQTQDSFAGKTVKLISDINLGDAEENNNESTIFYPIGYYNSTGKYEKASGGSVTSSVNSFEGIFDGNGHTVRNFYQNTWEMFGDYNDGYSGTPNHYKDAMGLFGYVNGGTVKNLTIDNFSSDGEFTPTGVIVAYADGNATFENIAITKCNPRVYNTGNGGIIGVAGDTSAANDDHITLKNITVDNTNKISALWGSYDVACGGLVGMYRGNVNSNGNATGDTISFDNCHVSAQIDVYNDVCGNYQYYAYRYAGMIIGSIRHNTKNDEGKTIPNMKGISAKDCTVNYGDWNDYYYCEFVKNGHPSYSGKDDYKFSRVPNNEIDISNGKEKAICIGHNHSDVEENQAVYLPFHQLFTGYSWGVSSIGLKEYSGIVTDLGITEGDQEESVKKFESKFTGDFLYRVGNKNTVLLESLFQANAKFYDEKEQPRKDNNGKKLAREISDTGVYVTIDKVDENSNVSGTFTANTTDWKKGTIQFRGTGVVKVTIQDYDFCIPTILYLEVVDATNITGKADATDKDVVLLNNISGGFTVSNGHTFYGNDFIVTCSGDGSYRSAAVSYGFVTVENGGVLDNVRIICDIFPESYLYTSEMKAGSDGRYPYGYSAVVVSGNSTIANCYIYGARNNIQVGEGNVTIKNTKTEGGSLSNIHIKSNDSYTVKLHNVVTKQNIMTSNYDTSKKVYGFGILNGTNESESNATLKLTGNLEQYNWIAKDSANSLSNMYAKQAVNGAFEYDQYMKDNKINTGIVYLNGKKANISDQRTNKNEFLYELCDITIATHTGKVYSITSGEVKENTKDYVSSGNMETIPQIVFSGTNENVTYSSEYVNGAWENKLTVDLDKIGGSYDFSFANLQVQKYGINLGYSVKDNKGNSVDTTKQIKLSGLESKEYTLVVTDNQIYDKSGTNKNEKVTVEIPFILYATKTSIEPPKFNNGGTATAIRLVEKKGGDWRPAYTALTGVTVTYWSASEGKVKTVDLSTLYNSGNISSNVWTYTCDDYTLTITGGAVHSDGSKITPVVANNTLYFASTNKAFGTGTTSRNIILTYVFTDKNASTTWDRTETVNYSDLSEYDYNSFKNGTLTEPSSNSGCVTPDTLITLADGLQVRVDSLTGQEHLLVWNMETGSLDSAPIMFVDSDPEATYEVIKLYFSDGTEVKVISEHGFWDYDINKYVYLDRYADKYIGHTFAKQNGDVLEKVELVDVILENQETTAWSPVTAGHLCYFVNGMLSMPGGVGGLFNIFDVDAETMTYDYEAMVRDIETYGLFTYEELSQYAELSREMFDVAGGQYLKVSIGKGNLTEEELIAMIERYSKYFE